MSTSTVIRLAFWRVIAGCSLKKPPLRNLKWLSWNQEDMASLRCLGGHVVRGDVTNLN